MAHACPNPTFRVKKALDLSEKYAESLRSFSITVMKKKPIQKTPMLEFPYKATLPRSKLQHRSFSGNTIKFFE